MLRLLTHTNSFAEHCVDKVGEYNVVNRGRKNIPKKADLQGSNGKFLRGKFIFTEVRQHCFRRLVSYFLPGVGRRDRNLLAARSGDAA